MSFVYTTCGGTCPATTHTLYPGPAGARGGGLWGKQVEFVSITLDPARDTPEVLAGYARVYDADPAAWHFLTGPPDAVARVVAAWGMWVKPGPAGVARPPLADLPARPPGPSARDLQPRVPPPAAVVQDVEALLAEEAEAPPRRRPRPTSSR